MTHTTHALSPSAVLQVFCQTEGRDPQPAYVLCVRGEGFELGEGLTDAASQAANAAFDFLCRLCRRAAPSAWRMLAMPAG